MRLKCAKAGRSRLSLAIIRPDNHYLAGKRLADFTYILAIMGLDFKSAIMRLRRHGPAGFSADALLWLLQAIRHAHFQTTEENAAGPKEMAEHLGRQAQRQFGDLAPAIFKSWGLESGADLFRALEVLVRLEAVQLSPSDTPTDYALITALLPETPEKEHPHG